MAWLTTNKKTLTTAERREAQAQEKETRAARRRKRQRVKRWESEREERWKNALEGARQSAKRVSRLRPPGFARRLTSRLRILPTFLVVGAQKSGTTSLFDYIAGHPNFGEPTRKEIRFFLPKFGGDVAWYRAHFPLKVEQMYREARGCKPYITGEATPQYMLKPSAAKLANAVVPKAKLIAVLRNPVDRCFSGYHHSRRNHREAVIDTRTPIVYLHFTLRPGGLIAQPLPSGHHGFVYVVSGEAHVGAGEQRVGPHQMAVLDSDGIEVPLSAPADATDVAELLLIAGIPLGEPLAGHGPFVMNTQEEIMQAVRDYQSGRMGQIAH